MTAKHSELTPKQRQGTRNKERGAEVERKIRHVLEANGYAVCRAAGSHGVADLIAWLPGADADDALWINVKGGDSWPGPKERRQSSDGAPRHQAVAIVWPKREAPKAAQLFDGEIRCEHERTAWFRQMVDDAALARKGKGRHMKAVFDECRPGGARGGDIVAHCDPKTGEARKIERQMPREPDEGVTP